MPNLPANPSVHLHAVQFRYPGSITIVRVWELVSMATGKKKPTPRLLVYVGHRAGKSAPCRRMLTSSFVGIIHLPESSYSLREYKFGHWSKEWARNWLRQAFRGAGCCLRDWVPKTDLFDFSTSHFRKNDALAFSSLFVDATKKYFFIKCQWKDFLEKIWLRNLISWKNWCLSKSENCCLLNRNRAVRKKKHNLNHLFACWRMLCVLKKACQREKYTMTSQRSEISEKLEKTPWDDKHILWQLASFKPGLRNIEQYKCRSFFPIVL